MKKGGGRLKGNKFERDVAKLIIEAFSDQGITQADVYRTPGSGGHKQALKTDPGDLVLSKKLRKVFPIAAVECKSYKRLNWRELFQPLHKGGQFYKWWYQAALAGAVRGGEPLLVVKENRSEPFVMFRCPEPAVYMYYPSLETQIGKTQLAVTSFRTYLKYHTATYEEEHGTKATAKR